jgi:hypothetical protein
MAYQPESIVLVWSEKDVSVETLEIEIPTSTWSCPYPVDEPFLLSMSEAYYVSIHDRYSEDSSPCLFFYIH